MRRTLSIALFCVIVVTAMDRSLVYLAVQDRQARAQELSERADASPELAAFLAGVRERTRKGDAVVLLLPFRDWQNYSRGYFRASYLLAGRRVLPILTTEGVVIRENVLQAQYVAAWRVRFADEGAEVWKAHGGTLVRRR